MTDRIIDCREKMTYSHDPLKTTNNKKENYKLNRKF